MVQTVVLTGGTNGIGLLAAQALSRGGHHLILLARDEAKAAAIRAAMRRAEPAAAVEIVYADFSRLDTLARAAAAVASWCPSIDVLINNAGMHAFSQRVTVDGYAEMLSVNYLAPWLLTHKLMPLLAAAPQARVVTVGSEAARHAGSLALDQDLVDTRAFSRRQSMRLYGKTKLMDIMFSLELARRCAGTSITANCIDPGFNATGLGRELACSGALLRLLQMLGIGNPALAAASLVRLATDPAFAGTHGAYVSRRAEPIVPAAQAASAELGEALWQATRVMLRRFI